nr:hypothetical protein [Tanacetum cinerariifolium]
MPLKKAPMSEAAINRLIAQRTVGYDAAYGMPWRTLMKMMTDKRMLSKESDQVEKYVGGLLDNTQGNVMSARPKTMQEAIILANDLMDQKEEEKPIKTLTTLKMISMLKERFSRYSESTLVTTNKFNPPSQILDDQAEAIKEKNVEDENLKWHRQGIETCPDKTLCNKKTSALTWWNSHVKTVRHDAAYGMLWRALMKMMIDKYCSMIEIKKLEIKFWNLKVKGTDVVSYTQRFKTRPKTMQKTIKLENDLMDQKVRTYAERHADNKRRLVNNPGDNHDQQPPFKQKKWLKLTLLGLGRRMWRNNNHRKKTTMDTGISFALGLDGILKDATPRVDVAKKVVSPFVVEESATKESPRPSYANATAKPSGTKVNFRTLYTLGGNGIDVVIPVQSIRAISKRFANTAYEGRNAMLENDVSIVPVCVKLHDVPVTKVGLAMIELKVDVELKENIVAAMPKIVKEGYYTCNIHVEYEWKRPSQTLKGILVGQKMGFKPLKQQVYQHVSKKYFANNGGNKKINVEPTNKVDEDSEDEVASVDNDMDNFFAKNDGYCTQSLLEKWKDSHDDYEYDPYDDDLYEGQEIPKMLQAFCANLDIKVRGRKKKSFSISF